MSVKSEALEGPASGRDPGRGFARGLRASWARGDDSERRLSSARGTDGVQVASVNVGVDLQGGGGATRVVSGRVVPVPPSIIATWVQNVGPWRGLVAVVAVVVVAASVSAPVTAAVAVAVMVVARGEVAPDAEEEEVELVDVECAVAVVVDVAD